MISFNSSQDPYGVVTSLISHVSVKNSPEGLYRILGFVHLYRASGIHLLAFFSVLEFVLQRIGLGLQVESKWVRALSLILCSILAFWIWSLQDFNPSFARPMATFYIRSYARARGAATHILFPLSVTFVIDGIIQGGHFFQEGMIHYYLAVSGGLIALNRYQNKSLLKQHLAMSIGSCLPIAVLDLVRDHLVAFMTPIYSLITIPLISYFLYPITLLFIFFTHAVPDAWMNVWRVFMKGLLFVPDLGLTFSSVSSQSVLMGFFFSGATIFVLGKYKISKTLFFPVGLVVGLGLTTFRNADFFNHRPHQVVQLDVKQGDAALIQENGRNEFTDFGSYRNLSDEAWIRKLTRYQVNRIDGALLTHLDEDHIGGLRHLLPLIPIACLETHAKLQDTERGILEMNWIRNNFKNTMILPKSCLQLTEVSWFESRRPGAKGNELMAGTIHELNENFEYFALGDGDDEQEQEFGRRFHSVIETHPKRIWKIGHHGSRHSSDFQFLKLIDPDQFWISVGKKNPYHHPNPETLSKLSAFRGRVHRTDLEGDIGASSTE